MPSAFKYVIIGSGNFGLAIYSLVSQKIDPSEIIIVARDKKTAEYINSNKHHPELFPELRIISQVVFNYDLISGSEIVFICSPSSSTMEVCGMLQQCGFAGSIIFCSKGIYGGEKGPVFFGDIVKNFCPSANFGLLAGPSFADEIVASSPTVFSLASEYSDIFEKIIDIMPENIKIVPTSDVLGVQIIGAYKNIMAIDVGIARGIMAAELDLEIACWQNAIQYIVHDLMLEMRRTMDIFGGRAETIFSPSGIFDITLTYSNEKSRNMWFGMGVGKEMVRLCRSYNYDKMEIHGSQKASALIYFLRCKQLKLSSNVELARLIASMLEQKVVEGYGQVSLIRKIITKMDDCKNFPRLINLSDICSIGLS